MNILTTLGSLFFQWPPHGFQWRVGVVNLQAGTAKRCTRISCPKKKVTKTRALGAILGGDVDGDGIFTIFLGLQRWFVIPKGHLIHSSRTLHFDTLSLFFAKIRSRHFFGTQVICKKLGIFVCEVHRRFWSEDWSTFQKNGAQELVVSGRLLLDDRLLPIGGGWNT